MENEIENKVNEAESDAQKIITTADGETFELGSPECRKRVRETVAQLDKSMENINNYFIERDNSDEAWLLEAYKNFFKIYMKLADMHVILENYERSNITYYMSQRPEFFSKKYDVVPIEFIIEEYNKARLFQKDYDQLLTDTLSRYPREMCIYEAIRNEIPYMEDTECYKFVQFLDNELEELGWDGKLPTHDYYANILVNSDYYGNYRTKKDTLYCDMSDNDLVLKAALIYPSAVDSILQTNPDTESKDKLLALNAFLCPSTASQYRPYFDKYKEEKSYSEDGSAGYILMHEVACDIAVNHGYGTPYGWLALAALNCLYSQTDLKESYKVVYHCLKCCLFLEENGNEENPVTGRINKELTNTFTLLAILSGFWDYYHKTYGGYMEDNEYFEKYKVCEMEKYKPELDTILNFAQDLENGTIVGNHFQNDKLNPQAQKMAEIQAGNYIYINDIIKLDNNYRYAFLMIAVNFPIMLYSGTLSSDDFVEEMKYLKENGEEDGYAKKFFLNAVNYRLRSYAHHEFLYGEKENSEDVVWYHLVNYIEKIAIEDYGWDGKYSNSEKYRSLFYNCPLCKAAKSLEGALEGQEPRRLFNIGLNLTTPSIIDFVNAHPEVECKNALYAFYAMIEESDDPTYRQCLASYDNISVAMSEIVNDLIKNKGYNTVYGWALAIAVEGIPFMDNAGYNSESANEMLLFCIKCTDEEGKNDNIRGMVFAAFAKLYNFEKWYNDLYIGIDVPMKSKTKTDPKPEPKPELKPEPKPESQYEPKSESYSTYNSNSESNSFTPSQNNSSSEKSFFGKIKKKIEKLFW